jgi:cyclic pyranopterin phosphate synthase
VAVNPLIDSFGRVVSDLRLSLIDKCNFRCAYCMPAEGLPWLRRDELLTVDEIERIAMLFVRLGVDEIKLTGGEPTLRAELVEIVRRLRAIGNDIDLSITTNGQRLAELASPLRDAGLDRVTVSCDSLMRHRFAEMTRRDALDAVRAGIAAAEEAGFNPIKVNCVVIDGTNDDEVVDFARLARSTGWQIRFIEYMPLDASNAWERAKVVPSRDLRDRIEAAYPIVADGQDAASAPSNGGPATRFRFNDGSPGSIGFISSVTEPFCATCNRVRVTADGQLRACLFALDETDLRTPLRHGASDAELEGLIRDAVASKWAGHHINATDFVRPSRSMSQIGG